METIGAPKTGPTAKQRVGDRLGHRTKAEQSGVTQLTVPQEAPPPTIPPPRATWTDTARFMWDAYLESPARQYWESTDYAACHFLCDLITVIQTSGYRAGQVQHARQLMADLMFTESARRQADLEINRTPENPNPARTAALEAARNRRAR